MPELKPCPFCGEEHIFIDDFMREDNENFPWQAYCSQCNAAMGVFKTRKEVVEAWNTRVATIEGQEVLELC